VIKLEFNKRNRRKYSNNWSLNNMLLHDQWVIEEIREEIKSSWNLMKMKTQSDPIEHSKGSLKGKVYKPEVHTLKAERYQINDPMLHLKLLEKQEQAKLKTSKRRDIIKIRAKIRILSF
jgi:hypothetical protein